MFDRRKIQENYTRISKQIKDFLLMKKSREFFVFLFFFVVAGAFWLLQTLNEDYEAKFSIPLRLKNVPDNVVITTDLPSQLLVTVKDKGTVLLNYTLTKNFFPVSLDFNNYKEKEVNNQVKFAANELEKRLQNQLGASTKLVSIKPDTLEYMYSNGIPKSIPVRLNGKISAARQYYISDTIFTPDSVMVYAPQVILDTIKAAHTAMFEFSEIRDTLKHKSALSPIKGAKFIPEKVEIIFPVDIYTEKTVEVPITGINFPEDKVLRTFPSKVQVTFQVGVSRFKSINAEDFVINVPYNEVVRLKNGKCPVKLSIVPRGINNLRINPGQVDFLIEQTGTDEH